MQKFLRALRIGLTVLSAGFFVLLFFPGIGPKSPLIRSVDHLSIATPHPSRSHQVLFVKAAQWSNENIPKNERIGIWAAGIFGYLSDHTTIHLEGLVNDYDFFTNYLSQGRTMEYIRDQDIRYLLVLGGEGNPLYFHTHPVYGIPTDSYDPIYSISEDDGTVLSFLKVRPTD